MVKRNLLAALMMVLCGFCESLWSQQGYGKENDSPGSSSSKDEYSYMGGKEHYLSNSPNYMAGKRQYLPNSPYYMTGKEQYFKDSETVFQEEGQIPDPGEQINSGGGEEFEYPEGGQNWVEIIIAPEGSVYYDGGGVPYFPIIRPRPNVGIKRSAPHATITNPHFGNFYRPNQGMKKIR